MIDRTKSNIVYGLPPKARNLIDSSGCLKLRAVVYSASEVGSM